MKKYLPISLFLLFVLQSISASAAICEKEFMGSLGKSGEKLKSENPKQFDAIFITAKGSIALIIDGEFKDQVKPSDPMFETPFFKCVSNALKRGDLTVTDNEKSIARRAYLSYLEKAKSSKIATLDCKNQFTQTDINQCATSDLDRETKKLNDTYNNYIAKLNPSQKEHVKQVQLAWIKFKDLACQYEASGAEGGSAHSMIVTSCLTQKTQQRNKELEVLNSCTEGDLSCPAR